MPKLEGEAITYPRTKILAPFSFFGCTTLEAADFVKSLELVDTKYTQTVNLDEFTNAFLPNSGDTFKAIWKKFYIGQSTFKLKGSKMGAIGSLDTELVENKYDYQNIEYQTMICFLLMLMSVSEREGSRFLYWLWFDLDDSVIVTGDNMATMLNDLVGPDIADPESKNKRHKKILKNLAKATKIVDGSNYTFKNFCVLDMQLGSPFLSRLEYVQKDLVNNFMDVNCWRKLSARVAVVNNLEVRT